MTLVWKPGYSFDSDASTYIDAVETADGQALETGVRVAINDFVLGCKQDNIWDAIKASCILAGARTLDGALVPLVGGAPTNFNFVSGDYNRETGLIGNGSTKYLDSNRANNADPQDDNHNAIYAQSVGSGAPGPVIGSSVGVEGINIVGTTMRSRNLTGQPGFVLTDGLIGVTRNQSNSFLAYNNSVLSSVGIASTTPDSSNVIVFKGATVYSNARLSFYSIGESLDLALLDTRVSNLMTAIGGAI